MHIQYLKIIQLTCFRICFVKQGGGESRFLRDLKGGMSLWLEGHVFFKGSKRGGGVKKYSVNQNENLQTPLLIKNDTSLTRRGAPSWLSTHYDESEWNNCFIIYSIFSCFFVFSGVAFSRSATISPSVG